MNVGDTVRFDASEFPHLGLDAEMADAEMVILEVEPAEGWFPVASLLVEWAGKLFNISANAVTL